MKLTDNIHLLKIDFEIPLTPEKKLPRFVNIILIFTDKITLIDTGVKGSERYIFDYINKEHRDISEIDTIILSHSHPDHIGSAAQIKKITNCKILAHKSEQEWIENIDTQNQQRPVPGFYTLVDQSVRIDQFVHHNQEISMSNSLTLKILESPGHSRGSLNILFKEDKILFTADSIPVKNDIPNYDNYKQLSESLETISHLEFDTLLTSWTPPVFSSSEITRLISEGKEYIQKIDSAVKDCYKTNSNNLSFDNCRLTLDKLGLPPFLAVPVTDKAFRSHL